MRTILHNHIDMGLGSNDIVASHYIIVLQLLVDVNLSFKQLQTRRAEVLELNSLDGKPFHLFAVLYSLVDFAAVAFPQDLMKKDLIFSDLEILLFFWLKVGAEIFVGAHVANGLGN